MLAGFSLSLFCGLCHGSAAHLVPFLWFSTLPWQPCTIQAASSKHSGTFVCPAPHTFLQLLPTCLIKAALPLSPLPWFLCSFYEAEKGLILTAESHTPFVQERNRIFSPPLHEAEPFPAECQPAGGDGSETHLGKWAEDANLSNSSKEERPGAVRCKRSKGQEKDVWINLRD